MTIASARIYSGPMPAASKGILGWGVHVPYRRLDRSTIAAVAGLGGGKGDGQLLAEVVAWGTATEEFVDRWRAPGDARSKLWEERFGENQYRELGIEAWTSALKQAGVTADDVDHLIVCGTHGRAVNA